MRIIFYFLLVIFFSGCISLSEFSKRKYTPGFFWNEPQNETVTNFKNERSKNNFGNIKQKKIDSSKAVADIFSERNLTSVKQKIKFIQTENVFVKDTLPQQEKHTVTKKQLDKYADNAETFGYLGWASFLSFLFFVFVILAITNANKVLRNPYATIAQKTKAYHGKEMAETIIEIHLLLWALLIVLILYLLHVI